MSTLETHMGGSRVAARSADGRKKLLVVGLLVVLAGLLAFQLPKLLKRSGSAASTTSPPAATTAPGAAAAAGGGALASVPTSASAKRVRAIRGMKPRDPFVPLTRQGGPASTPSSAATSAPAPSSAPTSAPAPSSAPTSASAPPSTFHLTPLTVAPAASAFGNPVPVGPAAVGRAEPTAATIWTNGKRQVVGVGQPFQVGDAPFELAAVNRMTMRVHVTDGSFTGGKRTITIREGRGVILENNATGVRYTLRFAGGTTEAPTAQPMTPSGPQASADPSGSTGSAPFGTTSTSNGS